MCVAVLDLDLIFDRSSRCLTLGEQVHDDTETPKRPDATGEPVMEKLAPKFGRVVLFNSRTVRHEVLPTHRKRFALTLWYFSGRAKE